MSLSEAKAIQTKFYTNDILTKFSCIRQYINITRSSNGFKIEAATKPNLLGLINCIISLSIFIFLTFYPFYNFIFQPLMIVSFGLVGISSLRECLTKIPKI